MKITVLDTSEDVAAALAERVASALQATPAAVLGLASGRTPVDGYAELRRMHAAGQTDWSRVSTFNLDEFAGLDGAHPGSFRTFMERHLFEGVNLSRERIHFLNGVAADLNAECDRYEAAIAAAGGIDLQLLGIGLNGHIGFNEPGDRLVADTHRVALRPETRLANVAQFGGRLDDVPNEALTVGMGTILRAAAIVLMATGESKAEVVARAVQGPLTTHLPASFLQTHREVEWYLDRAAASRC